MSIDVITPAPYEEPPILDDRTQGRLETRFEVPRLQGFGDLLHRTFCVYGDNFKLVFLVSVILIVPFDAIVSFCEIFNSGDPAFGVISRVAGLAQNVTICLAAPAIIYAMVIRVRDQREVTLGDALSWGNRAWLRILGYRILVGIIVGLGTLLLIVPGLIFMTWYALVDVIVTTEGRRHPGVMARSKELTAGRRWWIFGFYMLAFLAAIAAAIAIALIEEAIWSIATDVWSVHGFAVFLIEFGLMAAISVLIWLFSAMAVVLYLDGVGTHLFECPNCGYNLTGNVSGTCAECGQIIPQHVRDLIALHEEEMVHPGNPP